MLNTAEGKKTGLVDTNENFYYPYGIKYMGIKLFDVAQTNISKHFLDVADFIDEALNDGGKTQFVLKFLFSIFYPFNVKFVYQRKKDFF